MATDGLPERERTMLEHLRQAQSLGARLSGVLLIALVVSGLSPVVSAENAMTVSSLEAQFYEPPVEARPLPWSHWDPTQGDIRPDLRWYKDIGIAGATCAEKLLEEPPPARCALR
jgi:hypothetical protein